MTVPHHQRVYAIKRPHRKLMTLYLLRAALTGPGFPFVLLPSLFKYETLRYRFDDEGVMMAWGLLWRREIFLTYTRIQDIHLSRGVLERWMGLATINIQTAAGSSSAEMAVVGLIEFEQVRDFLYSKMRGARFGETEPTGDGPRQAPGGPVSAADEAVELLTDIRDEIRALGKRLKGAGK